MNGTKSYGGNFKGYPWVEKFEIGRKNSVNG